MPHDVISEIQVNNEWRDGEFAKFKINSAGVDENLWCRMCIPMIYAHWEGFVIDAFKILLRHLNTLQIPANKTPTNLVVVSLGDSYKSLSGKQSFNQRIDFTERFAQCLNTHIKFQTRINTKANLRLDVLKEIYSMFNLNHEKFECIEADINRLVQVRNCIAHGENSFMPTSDNLNTYIKAVRKGMDLVLEEIDDFLCAEGYLLKETG
ncbi:MAE_28990/MAE_18760 family HEPN-like nuclease [Pseudomonas monteilii]|uniref:MAE_28990/MAE_18760 family HEPN-like nuclease n=1 Tax=Pseudomonas monteilii TaxID=76759 RepID=UPI00383B9A9C